jgi:hypothetical protein
MAILDRDRSGAIFLRLRKARSGIVGTGVDKEWKYQNILKFQLWYSEELQKCHHFSLRWSTPRHILLYKWYGWIKHK